MKQKLLLLFVSICSTMIVSAGVEIKDNHEWVDLGLPSGTLWATCNIGANSPEEWGDYFAWGETRPKQDYSWETYQHCNGEEKSLTKYCIDSDFGTVDNRTTLDPEDDAAMVNWGNDWQIPSEEQCKELASYTTSKWTTQNGIKGRIITSISNGNSIFLPATNSINGSDVNTLTCYWLRSIPTDYSSSEAYSLYFSSSTGISLTANGRNIGHCIRPVHVPTGFVTMIELNEKSVTLWQNETKTLAAEVFPENAISRAISWESSNEAVAKVDVDGVVTAIDGGSCVIICRATDGSDVYAECQVKVEDPKTHGEVDGHRWVDLGLPSGTKWAICNIGADLPEEYGDFFAWGETKPKNTPYVWDNYKFYDEEGYLTKYCYDNSYGVVDNKTVLDPEDDAATANWGSNWQMPTEEQFEELINESYVKQYREDLPGNITSLINGNSIFLPEAFSRDAFYGEGWPYSIPPTKRATYWSRSLDMEEPSEARYFIYSQIGSWRSVESTSRIRGAVIRAVLVPTKLVTEIILSDEAITIGLGNTFLLTATVRPENVDNKDLKWESTNDDIAEVDADGLVTGVSEGICSIICRTKDGSGIYAECLVTVTKKNVDGIVINETNFPDEILRWYVYSFDVNDDGALSDEEISNVKSFRINNRNIQTLKGIEYFTAITLLQCDYCQLKTLDVSKNIALTSLICGVNQLKSLDVSTNIALTQLCCEENQLTSLDVSGCTKLTRLDCYDNQLTSLNVSGCTELTSLLCDQNQLTSLDVSGCTKLTRLECYQNQIKGNAMTVFVESLPSVNGRELQIIYGDDDQNEMTTVQVAAAWDKGWTPLRYDGNTWLNYVGINPDLTDVVINETNFPDEAFRNWMLGMYGADGNLTGAEIASTASIDVSEQSIHSLKGIEYFTALQTLDCSGNQLTTLDVSNNIAITGLYCGNNQLTTLDVSKNSRLEVLDCSNNQLTAIDVSKNSRLEVLDCSNNQLTAIDVSNNISLEYLYCQNNKLTSLDVLQNTKLKQLQCYQNNIKNKAMDTLVESLPQKAGISKYYMNVIYNENEGNIMTISQVGKAKAKIWTPRYYDGSNWKEYAGSEQETSVIYVFTEPGNVVTYSKEYVTTVGTVINSVPSELCKDYCTYEVSPVTIQQGANEVHVAVSWSLPFIVSKDYNTAIWYYAKIRSDYYLNMDSSEPYYATFDKSKEDRYLWAFVGTPHTGFTIINKGAGENSGLTRVGEDVVMRSENIDKWELIQNGRGFNVLRYGTEYDYINQLGGSWGTIGLWFDQRARYDLGGLWLLEIADPQSITSTVTFVFTEPGGIITRSQASPTTVGTIIKNVPVELQKSFCSYELTPTVMQNGANEVNVAVTWNLPFNVSNDYETATWYYAKIRLYYYLNMGEEEPYYATENKIEEKNYKWAFIGTPHTGFTILNKAAGAKSGLTRVGENVVMRSENIDKWEFIQNGDGFNILRFNADYDFINQVGSSTGPIGFWFDTRARYDIGGQWLIEPTSQVTVKAESYSRKYGETNPTFEYNVEGGTLYGKPEISCNTTIFSPVGVYEIIIKKGSIVDNDVALVNGKLTILPALLTISAKDYFIKQGDPMPIFEVNYDGFKNDETSAVLTKLPIVTTNATSTNDVGLYTLTPSGTEAQNYTINYIGGKLLIWTPGDVNGDGKVNITDAVGIVNYLLGNPSDGFIEAAADVNNDGSITITDAVAVVNMILENGGSVRELMPLLNNEMIPE